MNAFIINLCLIYYCINFGLAFLSNTLNSSIFFSSSVSVEIIEYGLNNDYVYVTTREMNLSYYVKMYNLTTLIQNTSFIPVPLQIFSPSNQSYSPNRLLEINNSHLAVYSSLGNAYEIF